jgi:hypothetical protein
MICVLGGPDPASAVQGVHRPVHGRTDRRRPARVLREIRRSDRRLHPETVQGVQLRHIPGPRRGPELVRRRSHNQGGVGARVERRPQVRDERRRIRRGRAPRQQPRQQQERPGAGRAGDVPAEVQPGTEPGELEQPGAQRQHRHAQPASAR